MVSSDIRAPGYPCSRCAPGAPGAQGLQGGDWRGKTSRIKWHPPRPARPRPTLNAASRRHGARTRKTYATDTPVKKRGGPSPQGRGLSGRAGAGLERSGSLAQPTTQHGCAAAVLPNQFPAVDTKNSLFLPLTANLGWFSRCQHGQPLTRPPASGVAGAGAALAPSPAGERRPAGTALADGCPWRGG